VPIDRRCRALFQAFTTPKIQTTNQSKANYRHRSVNCSFH